MYQIYIFLQLQGMYQFTYTFIWAMVQKRYTLTVVGQKNVSGKIWEKSATGTRPIPIFGQNSQGVERCSYARGTPVARM